MTNLATATAAPRRPSRPHVAVEPLPRCLLFLLPLLALWTVVRVGRLLCLAAQRVPVLVRIVRTVRTRSDRA